MIIILVLIIPFDSLLFLNYIYESLLVISENNLFFFAIYKGNFFSLKFYKPKK